jgi:hypothetical protein
MNPHRFSVASAWGKWQGHAQKLEEKTKKISQQCRIN